MKVAKVAIVGSPNVGKSTLLNQMVGVKNSIVSPTPHTTRDSTMGVCSYKDTQIIFVDTPGYIRKDSSGWAGHFIKTTSESLRQADVILIIADAVRQERYGTKEILEKFAKLDNCLIAVNKTDLKSKTKLHSLAHEVSEMGYKNIVYPISAKTGEGVEDLKEAISELAKEGEWIYESNEDVVISKEVRIAECVREKIFYCMEQEIPHGVETVTVSATFNQKWRAEVDILVAKESHRKILIGRNGETIKRIGIAARTELSCTFGRGELFLKVVFKK